jgi:outer membrane protein OmpA-like peptidoglycan-associated protein
MVPYEDLSASDNRHRGIVNGQSFSDDIEGSGIGNIRAGAKYQFFGDADTGKALSMNAFVELPTGDEDEGIVTGDTGYGVGLNWNFAPNWLARAGYRDPGDANNFDVSEEIQGGIGYSAAINDRFDWITELAATLYQGGDSNADDSYDLATGGRYWFGENQNWAVNFALRLELNQLSDTDEHCPIGGLVGLTFFPRAKGHEQLAAERLAAEKAAEEARIAAAAAAAAQAAEEARIAAEKAAAEKAAAPAPAPPPPPPAPVEAREEIAFPSSSDRLSNIAKAKLDEVALRLKQSPAATALIIGHADSQGSDAVNQALGLRRAEAAKTFLVTRHQIDGNRIAVESRGASEPIASNDTEAGREQNRRVVIVVTLP